MGFPHWPRVWVSNCVVAAHQFIFPTGIGRNALRGQRERVGRGIGGVSVENFVLVSATLVYGVWLAARKTVGVVADVWENMAMFMGVVVV